MQSSSPVVSFYSIGQIAKMIGQPVSRVRYAVRQAGIRAHSRVAHNFVYAHEQLDQILDAVARVRPAGGVWAETARAE